MARKMGSGQHGLGNLSFLTLCALFPTLSPASVDRRMLPLSFPAQLSSSISIGPDKWKMAASAAMAAWPGPAGRYHCQPCSQISGLHPSTWGGCCPCLGLFVAGSHVPLGADQSAEARWPWKSSYSQPWCGCSCLILKREKMLTLPNRLQPGTPRPPKKDKEESRGQLGLIWCSFLLLSYSSSFRAPHPGLVTAFRKPTSPPSC